MDKGTKKQLVQMQSLMERMEKHYTKYQAAEVTKQKLINEGLEELNATGREDVDTNEFFDMVSQMKGGTRASFGYVSVADLNTPTTSIVNPKTGRPNKVADWDAFGKQLGETNNTIGGVIKFGMYTLNWRSPHNMALHYNNHWVTPVNALRDKYGVEPIKKREVPTTKINDYGVSVYNGEKEELKGNTYSQQDMKTANTKKETHYYLISTDGNIIREATIEELKPYFKQQGPEGIKAFKKLVTDGKATEEEMLNMFKEYGAELNNINFQYRNFIHANIVYIITSIKGEKKRYFNQKLTDCIKGVNIKPQEFINLAKKMYQVADEQSAGENLGEFDSEFPEDLNTNE